MKKLLPFFAACLLSLQAFSQCPSPVVNDWFYDENTQSFIVNFSTSTEAETYTLRVIRQFDDSPTVEPIGEVEVYSVTNELIAGTTIFSIPISEFNPNSGAGIMNPAYWYYAVDLTTACANGETSAITPFYVSALSLLNDPGFSCNGNFYTPRTLLPDVSGAAYDTYLSIPASSPAEQIESMTVFVDLGHTFLGDLSITLISPQGTEISLLNWPNGLGGYSNMSILFEDGAIDIDDLPYNYGISGAAAPYQSLSTLSGEMAEGIWVLRVIDFLSLDEGVLYGVCMSINGSPCISTVLGSVYYDLNSNNTFDGNDQTMHFPWLLNTAENDQFNGSSIGQYTDCSIAGANSIMLQNTPINYTSQASPFTISAGQTLPGIDIPVNPIPGIFDLSIDWMTDFPVRPGFAAMYTATINNVGTECVSGASFNFSFPETASINASNPSGATIGNSSGSFELPELCPLQQLIYTITFTLDDTVSLGTLFSSTASLTMNQTDLHPENNAANFETNVVGSYDPNDKQVSHSEVNNWFVQNDQPLKYTVRFQNTGNYAAERVLIVDTLDSNLDLSTFELISTSHNMELTFNGHIAYFEYDQIFLPDSTSDFDGSIGYVRYSIEPNSNFGDGMEIENTAYIFFDFNAPIVTNTVETSYNAALSVNDISISSSVFPNPTNDKIRIEWISSTPINRIEIFDMQGKRLREVNVSAGIQSTTVDVRSLSQGIYVIKIVGDQGSRTDRFAVVK